MKLLVCLLISYFSNVSSYSSVPVLIWSDRSPRASEKSALDTLSHEEFENRIINNFGDDNLLLLVQDKLSVEDLSSHASDFDGIQALMKNKAQTYFPAVHNPSTIVSDLANLGYNVIKSEPSMVGNIVLKKSLKNVVVIELPKSQKTAQSSMKKTGKVLKDIVEKILTLGDFTTVFTAVGPNEAVKDAMLSQNVHRIRKRSVGSKALKTECVIMHLKRDIAYVSEGTVHSLPSDKIEKAEGICSNASSNVALELSYTDVQVLGNVLVRLNFASKGSNKWHISSAEVTEGSKDKILLQAPNSLVHVKHGQSLVSGQKIAFANAVAQSGLAANKLILNAFQVQAFTKGAMKFGIANDNQGFFTIAIWTGLLCTSILLVILLWGFYMLADLRTMDRFDDPKDKPLVANSSD